MDVAGKQFFCEGCQINKPLQSFAAAMKKRIILNPWKTSKNNFFCRECQCPPCLNCGKRAEDADSKALSIRDNYYCEDCKGDHKQKQCKNCEKWKSLSCYPESTRGSVTERRNIQNKHHCCTECMAKKTLKQCSMAKKKLKQCITCEKWKSLDAYPESIRAKVAQRRNISNKRHSCSQCIRDST